VSYQYCAKKGLKCCIASLKKECSNYYSVGGQKCVPMEVPIPNFARIDREIERLEQIEAKANEAKSTALQAILAAYAKKDRVHKQRKILKR
jgi:hypothetical protein